MQTMGLNKAIGTLAMTNSVCQHDQVLRREDGNLLRRALEFAVEGQRMK